MADGPSVNGQEDRAPPAQIDRGPQQGQTVEQSAEALARMKLKRSEFSHMSKMSTATMPPPGSILTGKQEHYLKRELLSHQGRNEIKELSSPTALQRFGAPFRSDAGEVPPEDSELPILRYIFVHHVRNFPFLDRAREKEFWQDKLQVFLESFANKHISSSEDRLEETKRRKLALKAEKLVELMMVSGIPTASGYEERIRFSEMEVVERGANENGLVVNMPAGHEINGWDVNVAGVRTTSVKHHMRYHQHAEFLLRVKSANQPEIYVGRRYGQFTQMHRRLRLEMPGKVLPPLPRKNKTNSLFGNNDDDADSVSSSSTQDRYKDVEDGGGGSGRFGTFLTSHKRNASNASLHSSGSRRASADPLHSSSSRRASADPLRSPGFVLYREEQRVSLRAHLRTLLQNESIAQSTALREFLTKDAVELNEEELGDCERRREADEKRMEEQRRFYEIARKRAQDLDVHMEKFRREIVESNGLSRLFNEIKVKNTIGELDPGYQRFAEWLRIEVAATLYHLFLAEDNSPELFAQAKRIHSHIPYAVLKNVIRIANPAAVMGGVLDLFLAQPFGSRSLMQRIFGIAINDGISSLQKSIDALTARINEPTLCDKVKAFAEADEHVKEVIRSEAEDEQIDVLVVLLRTEFYTPHLGSKHIGKVFNAYVAWNNAVENVDAEMRQGAELFAQLKQLVKLCVRQRDKKMMLRIIEEPTTLQLFRDLFTIFYEPLVRVYKSANVYGSITDFAQFADDAIRVIEAAQRQDVSADPNQTVQSFIDLCQRHEHNFYKFVHEVHLHDNGLFDQLMGWLEGILEFLRHGPRGGGKLDVNALLQGAIDAGSVDKQKVIAEANNLIRWQTARKKWHQDKTRQKMAAETAAGTGGGPDGDVLGAMGGFRSSDFGLNELDLEDLNSSDDALSSNEDGELYDDDAESADPIAAERARRARRAAHLRRSAGEPQKPEIVELHKLVPAFLDMLRNVLAE